MPTWRKGEGGRWVLATLQGRFVMHEPEPGLPPREAIVVERFDPLWPGETCAADAPATAALLNTRWRLVEIDGQPVKLTAGQREPFLQLSGEGNRVRGFGGCNGFERPLRAGQRRFPVQGPGVDATRLCRRGRRAGGKLPGRIAGHGLAPDRRRCAAAARCAGPHALALRGAVPALRLRLHFADDSPHRSVLVLPQPLFLPGRAGAQQLERDFEVEIRFRPVLPLAVRDPSFFSPDNVKRAKYIRVDWPRRAEMLGMPHAWPHPDPIVQDMQTYRIAPEQPYIHRLTRLGVEAERRGQASSSRARCRC